MAKTETQVSIRVTYEFKAQLEAQAARERRSVSNMIKIVLEDYLDAQERKLDPPPESPS